MLEQWTTEFENLRMYPGEAPNYILVVLMTLSKCSGH